MHFIQIIVHGDDSYALDVFEALNTTGLPLNAFETFRPEVIKRLAESSPDSQSKLKKYLGEIRNFLGSSSKTETKCQHLITSFALAESGEKRSHHLADQRTYLRGRYREIQDDRDKFLKRMLDVARIHQKFWSDSVQLDHMIPCGNNTELNSYLDEASFCLHYLCTAKHTIVTALIARFYSFHELDQPYDKAKAAKIIDFCEAIKATAAFFTLWMAMRSNTDGLDSLHRNIMSGVKGLDLLAGYCYKSTANPSGKELKKVYIDFLTRQDPKIHRKRVISDRDDWIKQSSSIETYKRAALAKFILLIANHNTVQQEEDKKFLKRIDDEAIAMKTVRRDSWQKKQYQSIEHIYPQNPKEGSGTEKLSSEIIDRLGNLTLLPNTENQRLSNHSWTKKKLICTFLAAEDENTRAKAMEILKESNEFSKKQLKKLSKTSIGHCLPLTKTLIHYDQFEKEDINGRGKHLLGLAWDILAVEWLGWPKEK